MVASMEDNVPTVGWSGLLLTSRSEQFLDMEMASVFLTTGHDMTLI
jgi:hypothetical protein